MSKNVFDSISKHNVVSDVQNPSSHNILSLSFEFKIKHYVPLRGGKSCNINNCNWTKASSEDIDNYRHTSEHKLADVVVPKSDNCTNCHCSLDNHKDESIYCVILLLTVVFLLVKIVYLLLDII